MRLAKGLRQEDLERYGLSWKAVQKLEYGLTDPKVSTLLELCRAFGVSLTELVTLEAPPSKSSRTPRKARPPRSGQPPHDT